MVFIKDSILITYTQTPFGKSLAAVFLRKGYEVYSVDGETPLNLAKINKIDILAETMDFNVLEDTFSISSGIADEVIEKTFRENAIRPMATLETFLPLLESGKMKRLFYISSAEASINETRDTTGFAYKMSKAALHQFLQMARNRLAPQGYTFRIFDPLCGKIESQTAAESAFQYITRRRGTENHDPMRDDETTLVLRDAEGRQHSW